MFKRILSANQGEVAVHRAVFAALGMALLTAPAESATGDRFAIQCTGTARFSNTATGTLVTRTYDVPRQIYVLDEAARRVQRALEPRQEFEDVCFHDGYIADVSFAAGLISVRSESPGVLCTFEVSRVTGEAEFFSRHDLPGGRYGEMEWQMTCTPSAIPVFDRSRNRF